jgi:hypothetical protein
MTFQAGEDADVLFELATRPILFVVRDPRLSVASRMRLVRAPHDSAPFPPRETGWGDLREQVRRCREAGHPYALLDVTDLRRSPVSVAPLLFEALGLPFAPEVLEWTPAAGVSLGQLGEAQSAWYRRVLLSTGIEPPLEDVPSPDAFPAAGGFRAHVEWCCDAYRELLDDPHRIGAG